jgi:predicted metalloendopeptidase
MEKFINGVIDFIWSLFGIEALIPAPHLNMSSMYKSNESLKPEDVKKVVDGALPQGNTTPKFSDVLNTQTNNSIYVPLGYIQKPFVDLDQRGIEYNLAHVGFTLAHEMSHALDSSGSKYDETGKLKNWWAPADAKYFRKIQEDVVKQYETFSAYDDIKFDAWPTIDEDLADISAMNICCEYLRDFQMKNNDILPIVDLSFKIFFVYFTLQQKQQINKKALKIQLITNPHPLGKYRCNVPLSRLELFRAMYNVKKGDKMWWHSTDKIW